MFLTVETGRASLYNGINRSMDSLDMFSSKSKYLRASIILLKRRIYTDFFSLGKNHLLRRSKGVGYSVRLSFLLKD